MTEILWNTNSPHSPLRDHELVELRLVDLGGTEEHRNWSAKSMPHGRRLLSRLSGEGSRTKSA